MPTAMNPGGAERHTTSSTSGIAAEPLDARLELRALALLDRGEVGRSHGAVAQHIIVEHARAALADGAHRDLGLAWEPELAHDEHVERGVEGRGELRGDGNAAARQAEHDRTIERPAREGLREPTARVASIGEVVHLPCAGRATRVCQSPSTSADRSGSPSRSGTSTSTARACSIRPR